MSIHIEDEPVLTSIDRTLKLVGGEGHPAYREVYDVYSLIEINLGQD